MELFGKLLNAYKAADKKLGGFLPGGGTGNVLSNTLKTVNPADVVGFLAPDILNLVTSKVNNAAQSIVHSGKESLIRKELPDLIDAASKHLIKAGSLGVYSPLVSGRTEVKRSFLDTKLEKYPTKVELLGGLKGFGSNPMFFPRTPSLGVDEPTVFTTFTTPGWITAHELGHAVDAVKRPYDHTLPKGVDFFDEKTMQQLQKNEMFRKGSPGAIVAGLGTLKNDDRSLLGAGIEGALSGINANHRILRKEIMADRYGIPIAREAGVPWNTKQNILAKGTYVLGAAVPGFGQGVTAELLNRGANTLTGLIGTAARAFRGDELSNAEEALAQYGYSPSQYGLSLQDNEIKLKERNPAEKYLYNYIQGLR
jgi:hypothetical protein